MILGKQFAEKLYSTGDEMLDNLLEREIDQELLELFINSRIPFGIRFNPNCI